MSERFYFIIRQIPNALTLGRIGLTPFIVISLNKTPPDLRGAFFLFILAALSDFLDGFVARRGGSESSLGAFLDPLADKVLMISLFTFLTWKGFLPLLLTVAVCLRDVAIMLGVLLLKNAGKPLEMRPLFVSKLNTTLQMVLIGVVLLRGDHHKAGIEMIVFQWVIGLTFVTTILSGFSYGRQGWRLWQKNLPL